MRRRHQRYLRKYGTIAFVISIALVGTLCASIGMTSWKFAFVGDELPFFDFAEQIIEKRLLLNPFRLNGVFGANTVLGSYIQALIMSVASTTLWGWKFANVIALFPTVIFVYLFVRRMYGETTALIAAVLTAFSKYHGNFIKIGNVQSYCIPLFALSLYLAGEVLNVPTKKNAVMLGVCLGISYYIYIGPLFPVLLLPFFMTLLYRKRQMTALVYCKKHVILQTIALVIGTFAIVVAIGFVSTPPEHYLELLRVGPTNRQFDSNIQILINIGRNFLLFWNNFDYLYNHFVTGPYLDPISGLMAASGILLCVMRFNKSEGIMLWLWIIMCIVIGLTTPYWYTATTRGILFVIYGNIFAAIALNLLRRKFASFGSHALLPLVLVIIVVLNLYEAQFGIFNKVGYSRTALILKTLTESDHAVLLYHSPKYHFRTRFLDRLMFLHNIDRSRFSRVLRFKNIHPNWRGEILVFGDDPIVKTPEFDRFKEFCKTPPAKQLTKIYGVFP